MNRRARNFQNGIAVEPERDRDASRIYRDELRSFSNTYFVAPHSSEMPVPLIQAISIVAMAVQNVVCSQLHTQAYRYGTTVHSITIKAVEVFLTKAVEWCCEVMRVTSVIKDKYGADPDWKEVLHEKALIQTLYYAMGGDCGADQQLITDYEQPVQQQYSYNTRNRGHNSRPARKLPRYFREYVKWGDYPNDCHAEGWPMEADEIAAAEEENGTTPEPTSPTSALINSLTSDGGGGVTSFAAIALVQQTPMQYVILQAAGRAGLFDLVNDRVSTEPFSDQTLCRWVIFIGTYPPPLSPSPFCRRPGPSALSVTVL